MSKTGLYNKKAGIAKTFLKIYENILPKNPKIYMMEACFRAYMPCCFTNTDPTLADQEEIPLTINEKALALHAQWNGSSTLVTE